jgi:hypothetical protein
MTDPDIADKITKIKDSVELINSLMAELHEKNVEIRIKYTDSTLDIPPGIALWRATEHVDYLKNN